jgi:hypothetical protein
MTVVSLVTIIIIIIIIIITVIICHELGFDRPVLAFAVSICCLFSLNTHQNKKVFDINCVLFDKMNILC